MSNDQLKVAFNRRNAIYKPGEVMSGSATFTTYEPLTVKEVTISFIGTANVYWFEGDGENRRYFNDTETLLRFSSKVWPTDGPIGDSTPVMPRGRHIFHFSFTIPTKTLNGTPLPGQFDSGEEKGAYISYVVKAHVARPEFCYVKTEERVGIAAAVYDLNVDPAASLPVAVSDGKTVTCWCCPCITFGQIEVTVKLPKRGYAVGEFIGLRAEIDTNSEMTVEKVTVRLVQVRTLTDLGKSKESTSILDVANKEQPVLPGQTQVWENEGFVVPLTTRPSPRIQRCRNIHFSHRLEIEVSPDDCTLNLTVRIPIVIGTVPLATPEPETSPAPPVGASKNSDVAVIVIVWTCLSD